MSDDPYDFEIDLPTSNTKSSYGSNGNKSNAKNKKYMDSDDDLSGLSDDPDASFDYYGSNTKKKEEAKPKASTKPNNTGTSVNALDKAKSFLSKYSTKPVDTSSTKEKSSTSSRVSRLELSLDDDDFSIDLSDSEEEKKKKKKENAISKPIDTTSSRTKPKKEEKVEEKQEKDIKTSKALKNKESTGNTRRDSSPPQESGYPSFDEEEELPKSIDATYMEDSISVNKLDKPPVANITTYSVRPITTTITTTASFSSSKLKSSDIEEEHGEINEIDSGSDFAQSDEVEEKKPFEISKPSIISTAHLHHDSILSDHGHYEDEFEEESVDGSGSGEFVKQTALIIEQKSKAPPPASVDIEPAVIQPSTTSVEPSTSLSANDSRRNLTLEYSMDFSDESGPYKKATDVLSTSHTTNQLKEFETSEHSALLESEEECTQETVPAAPAMSTHETFVKPAAVLFTPVSSTIPAPYAPTEVDSAAIQVSSYTQPQQEQKQTTSIASTTLCAPIPRVVIVREYENLSANGKPEMKDASTQFTGNHAAIQTELVPDGMQNILLPRPTDTSSAPLPSVQQQPQPQPLRPQNYQPDQPTSVPVYPYPLETMPSMPSSHGVVLTPPMFGMSSYREQLMILQHQIQQKRAEAERLFRERTTFKGYTTFKDTEMFLASQRPRKLELWEALQRVDPTLDEVKAKEIARVATTASSSATTTS